MSEKIVYLMRGLPSCGKSYTAKKLAGETGVICETDEYFYTKVGEDSQKYNYQKELMDEARQWNFERFRNAIDDGKTPIVVDRGKTGDNFHGATIGQKSTKNEIKDLFSCHRCRQ